MDVIQGNWDSVILIAKVQGISFFQVFYALFVACNKTTKKSVFKCTFYHKMDMNWCCFFCYWLSYGMWSFCQCIYIEFLDFYYQREVHWWLFQPYFFRLVVPEFANLPSAMHNTLYSFSHKFCLFHFFYQSCSLIIEKA